MAGRTNTMAQLEAQYKDGYILSEKEQNDVSLFVEGKNTFYDILNKLPEVEHGLLVKLKLQLPNDKLEIDWTTVPDNSKPIRYKSYEQDTNVETGQVSPIRLMKIGFGYEYFDKKLNKNVQKVQEI